MKEKMNRGSSWSDRPFPGPCHHPHRSSRPVPERTGWIDADDEGIVLVCGHGISAKGKAVRIDAGKHFLFFSGIPGKKLLRPLLRRMLDHLSGVSLFHDHAAVHEDHLICHVAGKSHFMGNDDHGGFLLRKGSDNL